MLALWQVTLQGRVPELKFQDTGVQNLNIDNCDKEHSLFLANDGYGLVQKQARGA